MTPSIVVVGKAMLSIIVKNFVEVIRTIGFMAVKNLGLPHPLGKLG